MLLKINRLVGSGPLYSSFNCSGLDLRPIIDSFIKEVTWFSYDSVGTTTAVNFPFPTWVFVLGSLVKGDFCTVVVTPYYLLVHNIPCFQIVLRQDSKLFLARFHILLCLQPIPENGI